MDGTCRAVKIVEILTFLLQLNFNCLSSFREELPRFPFRSVHPIVRPIFFFSHEERTRVLREAVDFGLEEAENLYENVEPQLYTQGIYLEKGDPARYLAAINTLEPEGKALSRAAYASLQATQQFSDKLYLSKQQIIFNLININISGSALESFCPIRFARTAEECDRSTLRYRTSEGSCNNLRNPRWGQANRPFARKLPPDYDDGISSIRRSISGQPLPSARKVSSWIHRDENRPNSNISLLLMQWGQFLDHDLTFTPMARGFNNSAIKCCYVKSDLLHPECLSIKIPSNDSFYKKHNQTCMEFVRSSPAPLEGCSLGPRNQINQATSYLDASNVYGSSAKQAHVLRAHKHGLLSVQEVGLRQSLLPHAPESQPDECRDATTGNKYCFRAGDKRVNEQPGLSSMHTLWVREHNRVARELASLNPHWNDEYLFEESRRIVIAEMQHITFNEFLPVVLGPTIMKLFGLQLEEKSHYWGYDSNLDATMANVFGSAAFRFGHSLLPQSMQRCDKFYNVIESDIELSTEMMNPKILHNFGAIDRLFLGMVSQETQQRDEFISDQLTNHLFQNKVHSYGMDLIALNIQRGRDHGIPPYLKWRDYCGLRRPKHFNDLEGLLNPNTLRRLEKIYQNVDDVDLFPGGMAEKPVVGGLVGPTFACLIGQVFQILRNGDRFWYENGNYATAAFTIPQLEALRKSSLARILCDNLDDVDSFQLRVMEAANKGSNPRIKCRSSRIAALNLTAWKDGKSATNNIHYTFSNWFQLIQSNWKKKLSFATRK